MQRYILPCTFSHDIVHVSFLRSDKNKPDAEKVGSVGSRTTEIAKSLGFEGEHGVVVVDVEVDDPAERAGIRPGDLITKVGTKEVSSVIEFMVLMDEFLETNKPVSIFIKNKDFVILK